jgi:nucleotide-binding universal stress UspA family protein
MNIRKVLVAVDGSKPAMYATDKAIDLAKKYGAELSALYVISPDTRYSYSGITLSPGLFPGALNELGGIVRGTGQKHLDKVKRKAAEKNLNVKTDIVVGITSIVKEIVEYAGKNKVDIIVIGSRGISGFKRMLLGSVASGVVTYAHCPVLVVR